MNYDPYKAHYFVETYIDPTMLRITLADEGLSKTDWELDTSHLNHVNDRYQLKLIFKTKLRVQQGEVGDNSIKFIIGGDIMQEFILQTSDMPSVEEAKAFTRKILYILTEEYYDYMESK